MRIFYATSMSIGSPFGPVRPPRKCPACGAIVPVSELKHCPVCHAELSKPADPGAAVVEAMQDVLGGIAGPHVRDRRR